MRAGSARGNGAVMAEKWAALMEAKVKAPFKASESAIDCCKTCRGEGGMVEDDELDIFIVSCLKIILQNKKYKSSLRATVSCE